MTKVAILQSNYIPWKGYFDIINGADYFVIYDTAQYTKNDWRNRNKIKTAEGLVWLTIPVKTKGNSSQRIDEAAVADQKWRKRHWGAITNSYSKAPFFKCYAKEFENIYLNGSFEKISDINYCFIRKINEILGIQTKLYWSSDFDLPGGKTEKLVKICEDLGADIYLSGPSAQNYLDESMFNDKNIDVEWVDYEGYPRYSQLYGSFEHGVSILDLIFNEGPNSIKFMKSFYK